MKKILLVIIATVFVQFSFSQSRWSFGFSFEPGLSGLTNRIENAGFPDSIKMYLGPKFSYSISGIADFKLSNKIHINSGIGFKKMGYSWGLKREYYDSLSLAVFPENIYWKSTIFNDYYYFLNLPINFQYIFKNSNKLIIYLTSGITTNYIFKVRKKTETEMDYGTNNKSYEYTPDPKKFLLNLSFGIGINYILNDRFKISMEPSYQYFINKAETGQPMNGNLYNLGFKIGIFYSLKKGNRD